jgi:arylsulfatase A-like enzyme
MGIRLPIWTIIFLAFHFSTIAETNGKKPNILICISEDHAIRFLANSEELGTSINPTPYLSRISQIGELHPLAYCTNASPSYTAFSLLTGKSKSTKREDFDSSQFLSQHFKTIGYETVFFGSWTWDNDPNHAGFDYWKILDDPEIFINPRIKDSKNQYVTEGHTTDVITDLAIQWVNKRSETKPFFALVSFQATKRPWIPPIRTIDKYNAEWFDTPETFSSNLESRAPANKYQNMNIGADLDLVLDLFLPSYADLNSSKSTPSIWAKNWESMNDEQKTAWGLSWKPQNEAFSRESPQGDSVSIWMFQRFIKNYLRCLYAMDENIGRLIDSIDSKVEEGYNFIYTSERGRFTGEFGWFGSEWMYEPSARIPLVFANFKGVNAKVFKTEEIFRDFDLYSLIKNLGKPMTNEPTQIVPQPNSTLFGNNQLYFSHLDHPGESGVSPHHGFRKGKYKIVHYYPFDEWEFFDLENDPKELQNLYNNMTHSTVVSEYKEYLKNADEFRKNKRENQLFSETWKRKQRSPENKKR